MPRRRGVHQPRGLELEFKAVDINREFDPNASATESESDAAEHSGEESTGDEGGQRQIHRGAFHLDPYAESEEEWNSAGFHRRNFRRWKEAAFMRAIVHHITDPGLCVAIWGAIGEDGHHILRRAGIEDVTNMDTQTLEFLGDAEPTLYVNATASAATKRNAIVRLRKAQKREYPAARTLMYHLQESLCNGASAADDIKEGRRRAKTQLLDLEARTTDELRNHRPEDVAKAVVRIADIHDKNYAKEDADKIINFIAYAPAVEADGDGNGAAEEVPGSGAELAERFFNRRFVKWYGKEVANGIVSAENNIYKATNLEDWLAKTKVGWREYLEYVDVPDPSTPQRRRRSPGSPRRRRSSGRRSAAAVRGGATPTARAAPESPKSKEITRLDNQVKALFAQQKQNADAIKHNTDGIQALQVETKAGFNDLKGDMSQIAAGNAKQSTVLASLLTMVQQIQAAPPTRPTSTPTGPPPTSPKAERPWNGNCTFCGGEHPGKKNNHPLGCPHRDAAGGNAVIYDFKLRIYHHRDTGKVVCHGADAVSKGKHLLARKGEG